LTAERTLKMWKLSDSDITEIKAEANDIHDQKKLRAAELEKKWARVDIKVPDVRGDANRTLVVLAKNTNINDFVDPSRDTPLFRLGDLSRLQIWVHPPEEYLPLFQDFLRKHGPGSLRWQSHVMADPKQTPLDLPITQIAPSLEPNQRTPTLIGYLDNPEGKYLVGQFVEATIFVPPPDDTVEVPTEAINQYEGQNFVFVQNPHKRDELFLRRVILVSNSGGVVLVRSKLTAEEEQLARAEQAKGRRALEPLLPGDKVITHGVVELTSALDELVTNREADRQQPEEGKR
jgi:multidrug efflux pump subunit AcrA (membrane-fusion protein)